MDAPVYRPAERVLIHSYDGQQWTKQASEMSIETKPFANGAFREAYRALLARTPGQAPSLYVAKLAMDPSTPKTLYAQDVEAQVYAAGWAAKFNQFLPSPAALASAAAGSGAGAGGSGGLSAVRPVSFVEAFVVEMVDRPGRPLAGCEPHIKGEFAKHNNNVGAVADAPPVATGPNAGVGNGSSSSSSSSSSAVAGSGVCAGGTVASAADSEAVVVANAFSHFTYAKSDGKILICDIQGVGETYTDPQIHTLSGKGFGVGNLGYTGIRAFLLRHRCNALCAAMGLPKIQTKDLGDDASASSASAAAASAAGARNTTNTNSNNNSGGSAYGPATPGVSPPAATASGSSNNGNGYGYFPSSSSTASGSASGAGAGSGFGSGSAAVGPTANDRQQQHPSLLSHLDGQLDQLLTGSPQAQTQSLQSQAPQPSQLQQWQTAQRGSLPNPAALQALSSSGALSSQAAAAATTVSSPVGSSGVHSNTPGGTPGHARPLSAFGQRLHSDLLTTPGSAVAAESRARMAAAAAATAVSAYDPMAVLDLSASWEDDNHGAGAKPPQQPQPPQQDGSVCSNLNANVNTNASSGASDGFVAPGGYLDQRKAYLPSTGAGFTPPQAHAQLQGNNNNAANGGNNGAGAQLAERSPFLPASPAQALLNSSGDGTCLLGVGGVSAAASPGPTAAANRLSLIRRGLDPERVGTATTGATLGGLDDDLAGLVASLGLSPGVARRSLATPQQQQQQQQQGQKQGLKGQHHTRMNSAEEDLMADILLDM